MRADRVHALQAQHHLACRWRRACAPHHQAGVAALRARWRCPPRRRPARPPPPRRSLPGPHHRQRLAAHSACASPAPRRDRSPSVSTWAAPTMARSVEQSHGSIDAVMAARPVSRAARSRTCSTQAANSTRHSAISSSGQQRAATAAVAPGPHHAFGEIEPDHQADPAVGVHAVAQQAGQRHAQRQHLQRQPGAARPQRRQPQLPGQAQHDQAQQAASGEPARRARARRGGGVRCGSSRWHHSGHDFPLASACADRRACVGAARRPRAFPGGHRRHPARAFPRRPLGLTASSLTFTTIDRAGAVLHRDAGGVHRVPDVQQVQDALQGWLVQSLVPETIARQVLGYLTSSPAGAAAWAPLGLARAAGTALALMLTIDRTLNGIWRVKRPRPLAQRVLIYWAVMTLGPLLLGVSLAHDVVAVYGVARPGRRHAGRACGCCSSRSEFVLLAGGLAALYRYVPNTPVRWRPRLGRGHVRGAAASRWPRSCWPVYQGRCRPIRWCTARSPPADPAGVDLRGVADRAAGRGDRRLPAQPADRRRAARGRRTAGSSSWRWRCCAAAGGAARRARGLRGGELAERAAAWTRCSWNRCWKRWGARLGRAAREADDATPSRTVLLADPADTPLGPLADRLLLPEKPRTCRR